MAVVEEEMVDVGRGREEDEEPAMVEETVWDISGCIWDRIVAIRSDCEKEEDPEEDVDVDPDPEEEEEPREDVNDDPDPDACCPPTADVTV